MVSVNKSKVENRAIINALSPQPSTNPLTLITHDDWIISAIHHKSNNLT